MAASASAAGGEPQKQLLSIIRDFAAEKSHGERTVSGLKRRLDDVLAAADAATSELEAAKRAREAAETELQGSQVQASIAAASIQALEATISHLQEEISKVGSELDALKSKGDSERYEFFSQMQELNGRIREFQQIAHVELAEKKGFELSSADGHIVGDKNETIDSEGILKDLVDKVSKIDAEVHALDAEYQKDLLDHEKELAAIQAKRTLMEAVVGEMKQLQELGGRVAEVEKAHASLTEELQRRYACPGCGVNNMVGMEEAPVVAN
ncbi:uncharacterized protein LOC100824651 isoform X2 [Brachypodium distachyon]|uniref:uncharacterized protein LOC100824651 isoform X2 n=1 Tax=Brachypodium distachyon TaxID=15368 RepID=UPI00071E4CB8|nr:uncharacterized protein LOC100824651 isoform X2 [Brachypodium distachyon]|eukprot:XP_014751984.1 uncharacterized protein LOC100824651 isoform X2 [Brachypodium distachyon]